jgi:hypothetical protein
MILHPLAEKLKHRAKGGFKGRHFEVWQIIQAVSWYLRYPLSYRDLESLFASAASTSITPPSIVGFWPTRR